MRTRYEERRRADLKAKALIILGVMFFMWFMFIGLPMYFTHVDCDTARDYIRFIKECKASESCTLREWELDRAELYYRIEIRRCPIDN